MTESRANANLSSLRCTAGLTRRESVAASALQLKQERPTDWTGIHRDEYANVV